MQQHEMPDSEALRFILPWRRSDKRALLRIGGFALSIAACAGGLYYSNHRQLTIREQEWSSAIATIEDARTKVATRVDSQQGGAMLYAVDVLAKYPADGVVREQWTTINQHPQLLADAQLQILLLKKKQCLIRWKPDNPAQIVAEIK